MKNVAKVLEWMENFARAVCSRDYAAGRALFASDVFSFGTYSDQLDGLEALVTNQWEPVWSVTRDFQFIRETVLCRIIGDHAWVAVAWQSQGQAADGEWHDRYGRATLILERRAECWKAIHSHFSLQPQSKHSVPE